MDTTTIISGSAHFLPLDLPLQIMRIPDHTAGPTTHKHDFTEMALVLNGLGKHRVGDEVYTIKTGDVFVILGDMSHGYPETDNLYVVNILMDIPRLGLPRADLGGLPGYHELFEVEPTMRGRAKFRNRLRLSMEQLAVATRLLTEIEEELGSGARGHGFIATALLMQLVGFLSRCYSQVEPERIRPVTQISKLLGYLERHYDEPLSIADMMRAVNMSQTSLMRTFGQIMGRSPTDHLIRLRVSKAQELLRRTTLPVTEIALAVGFCDGNYLARQFRRITGASPSDYRNTQAPKYPKYPKRSETPKYRKPSVKGRVGGRISLPAVPR